MPITEEAGVGAGEFGFSANQGVHWNEYLIYRPTYPASFFSHIYHYHSTKPQIAWSTAHDVGAGCGVVSAQLAPRFTRVIVSDPNDGYVVLARKALVDELHISESKFVFLEESAEESSVESGTVDLITACECIHWTNTTASLQEFCRQLKPGGTLVLTHYGVPQILDNDLAQKIWKDIWGVHSTKAKGALFDHAFRLCNTALEGIEFPKAEWETVKRIYINAHEKLESFVFNDRIGESRVRDGEEKVWEDGDEQWCDVQGIDWLKGYFGTWMPRIPEPEIRGLWHNMELALKGEKVRIEFPVVMVFATKAQHSPC
ncbi:S-adenosyl-L-methionine-dependent methyltransferase [Bisporella sp. PMI_857]|nr:S-adenosyl-L-methionine-dependent methyltransferase [Bisporella sp. PMI_857]